MELKDFVTQTLISINQGIIEAQKETESTGFLINPKYKNVKNIMVVKEGLENYPMIKEVEFNVAINVTEGSDSKIGIGVLTGILSGGASNANQASNSTQTTLKFSVPVVFPSTN